MSNFTSFDPDVHKTDQSNNGNDLEPPADGQYKGCELVDASAFTAKSGKDFVKFEWRTADGHKWTVLQGFGSDPQTAVTWSQVSQLGINPVEVGSLEQLHEVLVTHIGSYYDLGVKTNGQFRNTYINSPTVGSNPVVQQHTAVGQPAAAPVTANGAGATDDEDIPF